MWRGGTAGKCGRERFVQGADTAKRVQHMVVVLPSGLLMMVKITQGAGACSSMEGGIRRLRGLRRRVESELHLLIAASRWFGVWVRVSTCMC